MKKRGQFYLIAALVIIAVIASLSVVYNEAKSSSNNVVIYDLSNEINFEVLQLLDSRYFNSQNQTQLDLLINSTISSYSESNPDTTMIFIYGDREKANVIAYFTDIKGQICFGPSCFPVEGREFFNTTLVPSNGTISFTINDEKYNYNVEEYGQNFFLVLKQIQEGEIFKTTSPECSTNNACTEENKICVEGNCVPCGGRGQRCCQNNGCNGNNLDCEEGTCNQKSRTDQDE